MKKNCTHISQFNQSDRPKIATNWKLWHSVLNQIWLFAKISKSWLVPILQGILTFLRIFFWKITTGSLSKFKPSKFTSLIGTSMWISSALFSSPALYGNSPPYEIVQCAYVVLLLHNYKGRYIQRYNKVKYWVNLRDAGEVGKERISLSIYYFVSSRKEPLFRRHAVGNKSRNN